MQGLRFQSEHEIQPEFKYFIQQALTEQLLPAGPVPGAGSVALLHGGGDVQQTA